MTATESQIEQNFIAKLEALKYAYSLYEPREMLEDNKALFKEILDSFLARYAFALPELAPAVAQPVPTNTP